MSTPQHHEDLDARLRDMPVPDLDPLIAARAQRRARSALARPGEGTLSRAGLFLFLDGALVPTLLLVAGVLHAAIHFETLFRIFGG